MFDCCDFDWEEPEGGDERVVELRPEHCARCIEELRSQGVRFRRALAVSA